MQPSSGKQFTHDAQYWVEIRHQDHCAFCKDAARTDCASAPKDAGKRRVRVAQFIYFQEAIDYAQALQKAGVQSWIRKPRFVGDTIESEYSHYPAEVRSCCIRDYCGMPYNMAAPELRDVSTLRPFWERYCPKHRVVELAA